MGDRFEDMELDGEGSSVPVTITSELTLDQIVKWMWEHKFQTIRLDPSTDSDGTLRAGPKITRFPKGWKPQQK